MSPRKFFVGGNFKMYVPPMLLPRGLSLSNLSWLSASTEKKPRMSEKLHPSTGQLLDTAPCVALWHLELGQH
ncbi:uncharacterized protein SPSK_05773 [Sporothrix schenckii 1099-18]|uniref:Uncharacterized protein n=1 Tax=Sporothrix schenckii 1099-18 TaxID=1397361 RepID=A0A0F2LTL5_SPOSC|nr:uncharacterized protein SPSK_05773 [Sporothrix schenckii 1099-18]KJR80822.1 hypothetical protein SPSK_05773 [Sporothrix schenckii 1099-18]